MLNVLEYLFLMLLLVVSGLLGAEHGDPAPGYQPIECRKPLPEICMGDYPKYGEQCNE